jgi:hypothetical protein
MIKNKTGKVITSGTDISGSVVVVSEDIVKAIRNGVKEYLNDPIGKLEVLSDSKHVRSLTMSFEAPANATLKSVLKSITARKADLTETIANIEDTNKRKNVRKAVDLFFSCIRASITKEKHYYIVVPKVYHDKIEIR